STNASARPATSGTSGPTIVSVTPSACAAATSPAPSSSATGSSRASAAMPALPGAHSSSGRCGERASARTIACSRPPAPMTRTLSGTRLQAADEVVDRDRGQRLVLDGAARAELERDARDRLLVRRLDDVDEVEAAEDGPLRLHGRAELLDLSVDLADALRVRLDRLRALGRELGEHDVRRHGAPIVAVVR